jgi:hypothetical protein
MMFWRKDHSELEALRKQAADADREREAARLNLQLSARRLARFLEEIPLDDGLSAIGDDLAGNQGKR